MAENHPVGVARDAVSPSPTTPHAGTAPVSEIGVFEQPLNEQYRLFLRVEQLFERVDHHLVGTSIWDTHAALQTILELLQTVSRGDSKRELIKELDRQRSALARFDERPTIDREQLQGTLSEIEELLSALHARTGTLGEELRDNDLIEQLKQRATAAGRPGMLGLAAYQEWLQRPVDERHATVRQWLSPLEPARAAIVRCLGLIRESVDWQTVEVQRGFYEQAVEPGQALQLLRVRLIPAAGRHRFPEVSAGRQRFTIRFFEQETPAHRATQLDEPVTFELARCGL